MTTAPAHKIRIGNLSAIIWRNSGEKANDESCIHLLLAQRRQIAAIWSIDDVQAVRPDLSADQAWQVLQHIECEHDAEHGITWDLLKSVAEDLFGAEPNAIEL